MRVWLRETMNCICEYIVCTVPIFFTFLHMHVCIGGPLHLGDIEDIGCGEPPRIRCPWHKWCFELTSGKQVRPHLGGKSTITYPARLAENGRVEIGFKSLHKSFFNSHEF